MNIEKIREIMQKNGIIFSFSGIVSQSILVGIVETVKNELKSHGTDDNIVNSIFLIVIEQMQNIMSYASDKKELSKNRFASAGITVIGYDNEKEKYFVASSNKIFESDKEKVSAKIDKLNSMDSKEQRKYLRELLRSGEQTHDRGAGVGFVEMAKRSSEPIMYKFTTLNDNEYFEIKVYV